MESPRPPFPDLGGRDPWPPGLTPTDGET